MPLDAAVNQQVDIALGYFCNYLIHALVNGQGGTAGTR